MREHFSTVGLLTPEELAKIVAASEGQYLMGRILPDGSAAVLIRLLYTTAIGLGVTRDCVERRFCFEDPGLAFLRFHLLESEDDEPEGWIDRRPEPRGTR